MSLPNIGTGRLHYELVRALVNTCVVPSEEELCDLLKCPAIEVRRLLDELAEQHGVLLHPGTHRVWAIHPFSLAPTPFVVTAGDRKWWGNCAWCSLGIAVLLDAPCTISSTLGAEEERIVVKVENGRVSPDDLVVHFPVPMVRAWDNVVYTCSTILFFRDEQQIQDWSRRHRIGVGDVQPVSRVLTLSSRWYGDYLQPDWRKKRVDEAKTIFADLGFTHPVWDLSAMTGRF